MRALVCLAAIALTPVANAAAQETPLQPGQRIRLFVGAAEGGTSGTVTSVRADSLGLRTDEEDLVIPLASVSKLEVSRGRSWLPARVGAAAGALAVLPFVLRSKDDAIVFGQVDTGTLIAGVVLGASVGFAVGWAVSPERWEEVPLDRLRVRPVAHRDRFGLGVSVSF